MSESAAGSERDPDASGAIVVYGATGYTGRLIAHELDDRGIPLVLAGRNRAKLEALGGELTGATRIAAVPLTDGAGLRELLAGAPAVIACAGPFTLHGEPLIAAAAETGTNYLDTTGEQPFIRASFDRWGPIAAEAGGALVSGMGFDYAPGDLLAAITGAGLGPLEELTLAYTVRGLQPTRGTALSTLEMLSGTDLEWRDGAHRPGSNRTSRGSYSFPSPIGSRPVSRYPSGEQITVPRHLEVRTIESVIDGGALLPVPLGPLTGPLLDAGGALLRTPLRSGVAKLVGRLPEGPGERARRAVRFTIVCDVRSAAGRTRRGIVRGSDVYGITAVIIAEAAQLMAADGFAGRGALAPAQAFEAREFMRTLEPFGITVEIEEAS